MSKRDDDLKAAKAEAVRVLTEAVERALAVLAGAPLRKGRSSSEPDLLDAIELARHLKLPSRMAVYALLREQKIPCVKLGPRRLRFSRAAVERALAKREIEEAGRGRILD